MSLLPILNRLEELAIGSKLSRFRYKPLHYIRAQIYNYFLYPISKIGKSVNATTFFNDRMQVLLPAGMDIYLLGVKTHDSEIRLTKFLIKQLREGDTFLDIGAHFGYYTLLASNLVGKKGKVLSIEASPLIYNILRQNVLNKKNINALHLAATDRNEKVEIAEFPVLYSEYNTLLPEQFEKDDWLGKNNVIKKEVQGVKMDELLYEQKIKPAFIKIDVEGAEHLVIKGIEGNFKKNKPVLSIEFWAKEASRLNQEVTLKILSENNYAAFYINKSGDLDSIKGDVIQNMKGRGLDSDNIIFKV